MAPAIRAAGYEAVDLPAVHEFDIHRSCADRLQDGWVHRRFFERARVDLVVDVDTAALTLVPGAQPGAAVMTPAALGIPYVSILMDPVTAMMGRSRWEDWWLLLRSPSWTKAVWDTAHAAELRRLGVPGVVDLPAAVMDADFDRRPLPDPGGGPTVAFMGHPASSFFTASGGVPPANLLAGLTAAAVHADRPGTAFHEVFFDLYGFGRPPGETDDPHQHAALAAAYFNAKFTFNVYLAVKQRDRFALFLRRKLGSCFELIGDFWQQNYGIDHAPRIWDPAELYRRMRAAPVCLNLIKGNAEYSLNLRHFEATGHGAFMLTYPSPDLSKHFRVGEECDVFHHEDELLERISYYNADPARRRDVALAGQRRTLSEHLYSHRIETLVQMLKKGELAAPLAARPVEAAAPTPSRQPKIRVAGVV
ncbi:MAG: glycosyltransferase family 1 protein [Phycisphaerales bacterium]|nr:MAG: glycosyltransferase family 1 protein [Phycisphaerales bacterium]